MSSVYQIVTERIVEQLESGTAPWRKSWRGTAEAPRNLISGREYRGINVFLLASQGYASPEWLSFRQARQRGAHVRKGERASLVVFWKMVESREDPERELPLLRYHTVFNREQCEGLPPTGTISPAPVIASAEQVLSNLPAGSAPVRPGPQPCYRPVEDEIRIPARDSFTSPEEYYSTLYHELAHSTGHESRLHRPAVMAPSFGTDPYAREELVAEMAAAYLCNNTGILSRVIDNSAAYLAGWIAALRGDARLAVLAAAAAQKAADWLLGRRSDTID